MLLLNSFYLLWPIFCLTNYINDIPLKINLNYLSFTHSITCTTLSYTILNYNNSLFINELLYYNSTSYFIWDILQIIIRKRWNDIAYIYHHLILIFALYQYNNNINKEIILSLLYVGELSNIFNYIVYDLIKKDYNDDTIYIFRIIQLLWFIYYRVYILTNIILEYYYNYVYKGLFNEWLGYLLLTIYFMGYIWGYGQIKNLYNDSKKYLL